MALLLDVIDGTARQPPSVVLPTELVERASLGPFAALADTGDAAMG
jgi:DNA-binding LacI/PurR family transcriptional regulator